VEMSGDYVIAAPRERVWAALNDPEVLRRSIEGCESLDRISDTSFAARVVARIGPVKAAFGGKIALSEIDAPSSYTISGEGSGGGVGMARGSARVRLTDQGGGATRLSYTVAAEVSGKLAQIGSRLIDGAARKMADDFFGRFAALAAEGVAGPAQRAPKAKGRYAVELDLRWAAIAAVLLAAACGWIGYLLGHGAHP
jgi:carbon monoxide dehydrogenase subunit G